MKRFYVETFGCQMNVADSLEMARRLRARGFRATPRLGLADVVLVNTCTVRDHAEHKALSFLGRLADWKSEGPNRLIVFAGCAAERLKGTLTRRFPHVDALVGARSIADFDRLVESAFGRDGVDTRREWLDEWGWAPGAVEEETSGSDITAFVSIMRGCNFSCTYCVVPSVRGREVYRPASGLIKEIRERVEAGQREVLLLGQTVNSYRPTLPNPGPDGKEIVDFADLLEAVDSLPGVRRVRYMSPHPHYVTETFARRLSGLGRVSPHIHLPVQSGSNAVLARMRRNTTREDYLRKVEALRSHVPGMAVTTDFIVGFPGETEGDFEDTLRLVREADLDGAYCFKYSSRPGTVSAEWTDLPDAVKEERLARLMEETDARSRSKLAALVGRSQEVLVEAVHRQGDNVMVEGKTPHSRKIYVSGGGGLAPGEMVTALVTRAEGKTLYGEVAAMVEKPTGNGALSRPFGPPSPANGGGIRLGRESGRGGIEGA